MHVYSLNMLISHPGQKGYLLLEALALFFANHVLICEKQKSQIFFLLVVHLERGGPSWFSHDYSIWKEASFLFIKKIQKKFLKTLQLFF